MAKLTKAEREQQLNEIASKVGAEYGYETVTAEFTPFADFKVRWQRSFKAASFEVSDFLAEASAGAIEGLFEALFARIMGREGEYNDDFKKYVKSKTFLKHKADYIKRHHNLDADSIEERDDVTIVRTTSMSSYVSPLFKVIAVSDVDDLDEIYDAMLGKIAVGREVFE